MINLKKVLACVVLCAVYPAAYAAEVGATADYQYTVKAGDNLGRLSNELLDTPARWAEVAQHNKLPNANLIYPAQVLNIPPAWLKKHDAQARIEAMTGEVKINNRVAKIGDAVVTGDKVETANAANARLSLPDGSTLNVLEKTQLLTQDLQQKTELQQKTRTNVFVAVFRLVSGRLDAIKKKYPDGQASLQIQAMHGTLGVRGTHFRMAQEGENTLAEIEHGLVAFDTDVAQPTLALAGGQGTLADGVHPAEVINLLPAPTFPVMPAAFSADAVSFVMPAMAGAAAYRGELASDEEFLNIVAQVFTQDSSIALPGLTAGRYWLRLRAQDEHGLQGLSAQTAFSVKAVVAPLPVAVVAPTLADFPLVVPSKPIISGKKMLTGWQEHKGYHYELQMADTADFSTLQQSLLTHDDYLNLDAPPAGEHFLRLRLLNDENQAGGWCNPVAYRTE